MPMPKEDEIDKMSSSESLSQCLLSQYTFCVAGIGLGVARALKYKKGMMPMVIGGVLGSLSDLTYGLSIGCIAQVKRYRNEK